MISKQNIAKSTEIKQNGIEISISNPIISLTLPVEVEYMMAAKEITDLVALLTYLYLTIGSDKTKKIIEQISKIKIL